MITAKYKKKTYKCKIKVLSNKKFLKSWCKSLGKSIKKAYSSPYDQVLCATWYVNSHFAYGKASGPFEVLTKGKGTCVSGNELLVEILKAMGFRRNSVLPRRTICQDIPGEYSSHLNITMSK